MRKFPGSGMKRKKVHKVFAMVFNKYDIWMPLCQPFDQREFFKANEKSWMVTSFSDSVTCKHCLRKMGIRVRRLYDNSAS